MKKILVSSIALVGVMLTACSKNPQEKYIGYWEREDSSSPRVMQISQDGDTYLIKDNIFSQTMLGSSGELEKNKPRVLTKANDKLTINSGLGAVELGLSEDNNTLFIHGQTYRRIQDASNIEQNISDCHNMHIEQTKKSEKLGLEEKMKIREEYKAKFKTIPYCK